MQINIRHDSREEDSVEVVEGQTRFGISRWIRRVISAKKGTIFESIVVVVDLDTVTKKIVDNAETAYWNEQLWFTELGKNSPNVVVKED